MTVRVSAIVVTWNSAPVVAGCLSSLQRALDGLESEIVVVDNASSDDTVALVRRQFPSVTMVANPSNVGLAAANNQGMAMTAGDLVLIANPDVVFAADAVTAFVSAASRHPEAGWLVPRVTYEDGTLQTSAGDLPTLGQTLLGRQAARRRAPGEASGFWWDGWDHATERRIGRGFECAYVVRRSAVEQIGPQDVRFKLDWEGVDWTERFTQAGWQIWFVPTASVVHLGGTSRRLVPFRSVVSQHRGMYLYFSTRRRPWQKPVLAVVFSLRAAGKLALTALGVPLYSWAHRDRRAA
jgi:hypothetical protein